MIQNITWEQTNHILYLQMEDGQEIPVQLNNLLGNGHLAVLNEGIEAISSKGFVNGKLVGHQLFFDTIDKDSADFIDLAPLYNVTEVKSLPAQGIKDKLYIFDGGVHFWDSENNVWKAITGGSGGGGSIDFTKKEW